MIDKIRNDISKKYPKNLVDALIDSYVEIKEQYYLNKHEPSELNGGKFVEACARIIEQELMGQFTPLGTSIKNMVLLLRNFETSPVSHHDSFRLHIPRALLSIYNIRNRRGVGHLGGDVCANIADATLIATSADWVLAELYRMFYTSSLEEAQAVVTQLVKRKIVLVHEVGEIKRVLANFLNFKEQTLLFLASSYPDSSSDNDLFIQLEYSSLSAYKSRILRPLHKARMLNYSDQGECVLLPPGLKFVEDHYQKWLMKLNEGEAK